MDELTLTDADGVEVFYRRWMPDDAPRGVVLIVHGASEHSARYGRVAGVLCAAGFAVYAHDQRGHGRTAAATGPGRIGPGDFGSVIGDIGELRRRAEADLPGAAVVVFGHSMGSVIVQAYVEGEGDGLVGYVLSGTMGPVEGIAELASGLREAVDAGMGDEPLDTLAGFNAAFEPARTAYDWLSRDPDEVDKYVEDPFCGSDMPLTYGFVAEMLGTLSEVMDPAGIARIPKDLPVLLMTGDEDPVSDGASTVHELEKRLRDAGLDVTAHYYAGARHEILNETNRDEVHADLLAWLDARVA